VSDNSSNPGPGPHDPCQNHLLAPLPADECTHICRHDAAGSSAESAGFQGPARPTFHLPGSELCTITHRHDHADYVKSNQAVRGRNRNPGYVHIVCGEMTGSVDTDGISRMSYPAGPVCVFDIVLFTAGH